MSFEWIASHQSAKPTTEIPLLSSADIRAIEASNEPVIGHPGLMEQAGHWRLRVGYSLKPHTHNFFGSHAATAITVEMVLKLPFISISGAKPSM